MKQFIYKILITCSSLLVLYHLTIGYQLRSTKIELLKFFDKEKIIYLRSKVKDEIKKSLNKKNILSPEDAKLIGKFIEKITNEIKENK
jgi:hypothetical protein